MSVRQIAGLKVYVCPDEGPSLADYSNLMDLIGDLFGEGGVMLVVIPLERLGPDFLRLSCGVAGEVLQKLVNYRLRVAVLGDTADAQAQSGPLRDFIGESNRGRTVWFVDDLAGLEARLRG